MKSYVLKMMILIIPMMGCATMKESLMLGVGTGAATGAVAGLVVGRQQSQAALTGAAIGAVVGGVASYFIHDSIESRDSKVRRETLFNLEKFSVSRPGALEKAEDDYIVDQSKVETQCFDTEVHGSKLIEAHCESVIVGSPEWAKKKSKYRNNQGE